MLNRGGNDVLAFPARFEGGMKRGVVRFRSTTGEHDFARFAAKKGRDPFPRLLDRIAHLRGKPITTRRVGEIFVQKRPHRLQYRRIDRRRRVVIEISDLVRRGHRTKINGIPLMRRCKPSPYPVADLRNGSLRSLGTACRTNCRVARASRVLAKTSRLRGL